MRLLGLDYGLKRIGLSYSEGSLAQPMGKLTVKSEVDAIQKELSTAHEFEAEVIVIGLPDPDRIGAEEFGKKLESIGKINVEFVDETLTSQVAMERLKGNTLKKRRAMIDSAAATLILASYLEGNALKK